MFLKKLLTIIIILVILTSILLPVEHNYGDNIYGFFKFKDSPVVQVDEETYICSKDNCENFIDYMKNDGWNVSDQMGMLYTFEKDGEKTDYRLYFKEFYAQWVECN